jgi:hypothetical protein
MTIAELIKILLGIQTEHGDDLPVTVPLNDIDITVDQVEVKDANLDYGKYIKLQP